MSEVLEILHSEIASVGCLPLRAALRESLMRLRSAVGASSSPGLWRRCAVRSIRDRVCHSPDNPRFGGSLPPVHRRARVLALRRPNPLRIGSCAHAWTDENRLQDAVLADVVRQFGELGLVKRASRIRPRFLNVGERYVLY